MSSCTLRSLVTLLVLVALTVAAGGLPGHAVADGTVTDGNVADGKVAGGKAAESSEPAAEPAKLQNTIRWSTASEVDNFGFDVYRGTDAEGPFDRLTKKPMLGSGTSDLQHDYAFVDDTIEPGVAYFYYVEEISLAGTRKKITPVSPPIVKGEAPEAEAPETGAPADDAVPAADSE